MPGLLTEPLHGAIAKLLLIYAPCVFAAWLGGLAAMLASVRFLASRDFRFDSWAVAATEVGLTFLGASLAVGVVWDRVNSGRWWNWDAPLTAAMACWLVYAGYLMLRRAIEEPSQRAIFSAVFSVLAFLDIPVTSLAVKWWTAEHPAPVLWEDLKVPPDWWTVLALNAAGIVLLGAALVTVRMRQEEEQRELDSLRRTLHAF